MASFIITTIGEGSFQVVGRKVYGVDPPEGVFDTKYWIKAKGRGTRKYLVGPSNHSFGEVAIINESFDKIYLQIDGKQYECKKDNEENVIVSVYYHKIKKKR